MCQQGQQLRVAVVAVQHHGGRKAPQDGGHGLFCHASERDTGRATGHHKQVVGGGSFCATLNLQRQRCATGGTDQA